MKPRLFAIELMTHEAKFLQNKHLSGTAIHAVLTPGSSPRLGRGEGGVAQNRLLPRARVVLVHAREDILLLLANVASVVQPCVVVGDSPLGHVVCFKEADAGVVVLIWVLIENQLRAVQVP